MSKMFRRQKEEYVVDKDYSTAYLFAAAYYDLVNSALKLSRLLDTKDNYCMPKEEEDYIVITRDHIQDMAADMKRYSKERLDKDDQ